MKTITTKLSLVFLFIILTGGFAFGQTDLFFDKADVLFGKYVSNGKVDYAALKENPEALLSVIEKAKTITVSSSNTKTYQAFWINAYNISVIKGIIDNYPIKSPLDKKGFFDKIKYEIGGKFITLNDIEHKLLRGVFKEEARFHFVLVCAGLGCPPIINKAYLPASLEAQLQQQTEIALNNPNFIKVKGKKVQLSQIFEWFKGDFTHSGNEIEYINKFRKEPIPTNAKVSYYSYDWRLNSI